MTVPAYQAVPYEDYPVTETHLDNLHVAARRAGLLAARPEAARVLELGCAHAVNLMPMAFHLPRARFLGVDLSPTQIERATSRATVLGLPNLELRAADVLELELGDARFDYIIAHGLFSWVPEPVRERILALCREHLEPGGVAYLSYNAMPAWGIRNAVRVALLEGVDLQAELPQQLAQARALLRTLERAQPLAGTAEGALIAAELQALGDKPDAYLVHEYLVKDSRAFYLREVVERAEGAGLRWLGDVAPTGIPPREQRATRQTLRSITDDPTAVEQLFDVVGFRQFRASLLCRADAPIESPDLAELLEHGHLAAPPSPGVPAAVDAVGAVDGPPCAAELLDRLRSRWPADLGVGALASALGVEPAALVEPLLALIEDEHVRLRPRSLPIGSADDDAPQVAALTRFEARHLPFVTTPLHEHAPLDAFHAALIEHLDGRSRPALVDALVEDILAGRLRLAAGTTPGVEKLRAALPSLIDAGLERLHAAGLLLAPGA